MEFIAAYWWLWLVIFFVGYGIAGFFHVKNMNEMEFKNVKLILGLCLFANVSFLLFIIGVVVHLIKMATG